MAAINELLKQVSDPVLRKRLEEEIERLSKNKKFGLVFEDHIPERTRLYGVAVKPGSQVTRRADTSIDEVWRVLQIEGEEAVCCKNGETTIVRIPITDLVAVAQFGEPIYPYLEPVDAVCNAPDSNLWHTLIEADNYHALQLLEYLYAGQVDCIYIDPPYNTGVGDWKYNDAYVDDADHWSHSKWLSMMKKRLVLAGKLMSKQGALVISIGYQEVNRLVLLCEELFKDKQVVTVTVQTSGGKPSGGFNYQQEYLVFVVPLDFKARAMKFTGGVERTPFEGLTLSTFNKTNRPNQTYPIFVDSGMNIVGVGKSLAERSNDGLYTGNYSDFPFDYSEAPNGTEAVWPISSKGAECVWRLIPSRLLSDWNKGYIKVSPNKSKVNPNKYSIQYLPDGVIKKIKSGDIEVLGHEPDKPTLVFGRNKTVGSEIPTIWNEKSFYTAKGTAQIQDIFGGKEFPYPKPLDLITEVLRACTSDDSLILDFFAGSGTTLNAVNLLNAENDGRRRCIIITNNELSKAQEKALYKMGIQPGDNQWEQRGICASVTWPRTKNTILGTDSDGMPLDGEYPMSIHGDIPNMADGFAANCEYFKLGFMDKTRVTLGAQFREILPLLWLKTGAVGRRPQLTEDGIPDMMILPENGFAVLNDETQFASFARALKNTGIDKVFFATNSEPAFREMSEAVEAKQTWQLYRNYIDNFTIGARRAVQ